MENASKALLIAGAVLLSLAVISIGIAIVNNAKSKQEGTINEIDVFTKQMHNKVFEKYVGEGINNSQMRQCISEVMTNNSQENVTDVCIRIGTKRNGEVTNYSEITALDDMKKLLNGNDKNYRNFNLIDNFEIICIYENDLVKELEINALYNEIN